MHRATRLEIGEDADIVKTQNSLTGGDEVDLRGARVCGLLELVESAQNQPILI